MPLPAMPSQNNVATTLWATAKALPFALFFLAALLLGNAVQMLSVVTLPFSRRLFRAINRNVAAAWWGGCVLALRWLHGVQVEVTGEPLPPDENALLVVNHQSMTDIPVLLDLALRHRRLGDLKWYVKDILKYVPGIGWGMLFLDCLFIRRDWTADQSVIQRVFSRIVKHRVPVWIVSFLEGTRLTPEKLKNSQDYAASKEMPTPQHLLIPRTKGFVATLEGLAGHLDAVYDVSIGYIGSVPNLRQWIVGYASRVTVHVRRTPIADLPPDADGRAAWALERYREMDQQLDAHYSQEDARQPT